MLTLEGLKAGWGTWELAADLAIAPGERVALIGPSGAGKSTLLALIAGHEAPRAGRVLWGGEDLTDQPPHARPISMIFQDNNLFPHMSAAANVGLGLRPDLRLSARQWQAVEGALARVGLEGFGTRKPGQLSGGQVARVALARVLLQEKPVMLLDEPFGALGPALRAEMLDLVGQLAGETGATLMIVTHEPEDARRIADSVLLVADGRAHPPVATAEIFDNPPPAFTAYLGL
ncbi:MAG: thiamine ABC transporter ATP-binding protein [Rhodobacterales bacterium]|nr:MAG: thiamine ABC transporter ATP-binding protein [Rhodobacterales bacterium]